MSRRSFFDLWRELGILRQGRRSQLLQWFLLRLGPTERDDDRGIGPLFRGADELAMSRYGCSPVTREPLRQCQADEQIRIRRTAR